MGWSVNAVGFERIPHAARSDGFRSSPNDVWIEFRSERWAQARLLGCPCYQFGIFSRAQPSGCSGSRRILERSWSSLRGRSCFGGQYERYRPEKQHDTVTPMSHARKQHKQSPCRSLCLAPEWMVTSRVLDVSLKSKETLELLKQSTGVSCYCKSWVHPAPGTTCVSLPNLQQRDKRQLQASAFQSSCTGAVGILQMRRCTEMYFSTFK